MSSVAAPVVPLPPVASAPAEPGAIEPAGAPPSRAGRAGRESTEFAEVLAGTGSPAVSASPGEPGREDATAEDTDRDSAAPEDAPAMLAAVGIVVVLSPPASVAGTPLAPTADKAETPFPVSPASGPGAAPSPAVQLPVPAPGPAEATSTGAIAETPPLTAAGVSGQQAPGTPAAGAAAQPRPDAPPAATGVALPAAPEAEPGAGGAAATVSSVTAHAAAAAPAGAAKHDAALLRAAVVVEVETGGSAPAGGLEARDPALSLRAALDVGAPSAAAPPDRHGDLGGETDPGDHRGGGDSALDAAAIGAPLRPGPAADARTEASERIGTRPPVEQVAEHVTLVVRTGRQAMRFRLDPPDLGHVAIDAVLDGRTLSLRIVTEQESVCDALERSLPRLREALAQQGLDAGQVTIQLGVDSGGRRAAGDAAPLLPPLPSAARPARPATPTQNRARTEPAGLLDLWA